MRSAQPELARITLFCAAHIVLAILIRNIPVLGMVHALAVLGIGIVVASRGRAHQVAYVVAYIAGSEVLWRMTRVGVFWEFGKYAASVVLVLAIIRVRGRRNVGLAAGYFGLLLPSSLLTLIAFSPDLSRQYLSFNLSGPLALALCVVFFSNIRLTTDQLHTTFFVLLAPVIGIATLTYVTTMSVDNIVFTGQSNSVTSGGFGPNQVSSMLGLGLLLALLLLLERGQPWRLRGPLLFVAVAFATQAALTFSRGGLVLASLSAFVAIFYLVRDRRTRVTLLILGTLLFAVGKYVVVPRLEVFTQGKITERYTSTKTSRRDVIASNDLSIFVDEPILGVGPGAAATFRSDVGANVAAHTEFTRMLAEHGILGAFSLLLLLGLGVRTARTARTLKARAFVLAMLCWFTLFLLINAMRTFAPEFLFGLACAIAWSSVPPAKRAPAGTPR